MIRPYRALATMAVFAAFFVAGNALGEDERSKPAPAAAKTAAASLGTLRLEPAANLPDLRVVRPERPRPRRPAPAADARSASDSPEASGVAPAPVTESPPAYTQPPEPVPQSPPADTSPPVESTPPTPEAPAPDPAPSPAPAPSPDPSPSGGAGR